MPTQNANIPKTHRVSTNFWMKVRTNFALILCDMSQEVSRKCSENMLDELFRFGCVFSTYGGGSVSKRRSNPISGRMGGGTVGNKDQTDFHRKPNCRRSEGVSIRGEDSETFLERKWVLKGFRESLRNLFFLLKPS